MCCDLLTVAAQGVGHGFVAAVRQSPVVPAVGTLARRLLAGLLLGLTRADADDPVHQLALRLLLLQIVVLGNVVDEFADLVGLAEERGIGRALGELFDLMEGVKLQELLGDKRVNVCAVARVVQVVAVVGQQAGVADRSLALPFCGWTGPFGDIHRIIYKLPSKANIWVTEAFAYG